MNRNTSIAIAIIALALGLGIGYAMSGSRAWNGESAQNISGMHVMPDGSMMSNGNKSADMMSMTDMMDSMNAELRGKSGDAFDQSFLSEMIVHHQGAVEMAELALANAKHQEIKDLANVIIAAQNKEIADMKAWQKAWYGR